MTHNEILAQVQAAFPNISQMAQVNFANFVFNGCRFGAPTWNQYRELVINEAGKNGFLATAKRLGLGKTTLYRWRRANLGVV